MRVSGSPSYVLDCIDDVKTKCELLVYCRSHSIPVMTAFGAGAKADPTRIHIADFTDVICAFLEGSGRVSMCLHMTSHRLLTQATHLPPKFELYCGKLV